MSAAQLQLLDEYPVLRERVIADAWANGDLSWKLKRYQRPAYFAIKAAMADPLVLKYCVNISRRWGKTFVLCLIASELAQRVAKARIRFAAPELDELMERVVPIMDQIHEDCPEHLRPVWRPSRKVWIWPNGARMVAAGVNRQGFRKLRGSGAELALIDEGGFIDGVDKLIGDVLIPQLVGTRGTLIGGSTPPDSAAHEFVDFHDACKADGNLFHADIHSTDWPQWEIDLHASECGGTDTVRFRREWLAEYVTDSELQIIPDWIRSTRETPSPYVRAAPEDVYRRFWRRYTIMDIGATRRDFTCVLFGHYNFAEARFYVERELVDRKLPRMKSGPLAKRIREIERELWGANCPANRTAADDSDDMDAIECPRRFADNNDPRLLLELATDADNPIVFMPTRKESLPRMVNRVGMWVGASRVHVDPSCEYLIDNLEKGTWKNENYIGIEFVRTTSLGHCDGVAALVYGLLNVNETTSPVPRGLHYDPARQRWRDLDEGRDTSKLAELFGPPRFDS